MELSTREQRCLQRNKSKCQRHIGFSLHASPHRTFTKEKIIVPFSRDQDEALRRLTHLRKAKLAKSKCPVNMRESTGHTKGGEWWGYWATLDQIQHHRAPFLLSGPGNGERKDRTGLSYPCCLGCLPLVHNPSLYPYTWGQSTVQRLAVHLHNEA